MQCVRVVTEWDRRSACPALAQLVRLIAQLLVAFAVIRPATAQTQYTGGGTPTGLEEEIRWKLNRGRFDSASENRFRGTTYTDIPSSCGPLAPNQDICLSARHQSEDMAKANLFQHQTVTNSLYYNPVTQPNPWDRMKAEGYNWNNAGENIAAGYSGSESVYVGWWNSTGHRENMYNSAYHDVGNGYYYWTSSTYQRYYTMDLGSTGNICYFTDTIFQDTNSDGIYEQGEGKPGVAILLTIGGSTFGYYDVSSAVGSFAVPIQSITAGATVQVVFSNTTSASLTLSIPRDYTNYSTVSLAPGQSRLYGAFTQPSTLRNIGLRDVTPATTGIVATKISILTSRTNALLSWPSVTGQSYQMQWTTNLVVWNGLTNAFQSGTGSNMTWLDTNAPARGARFYRLLIRKP